MAWIRSSGSSALSGHRTRQVHCSFRRSITRRSHYSCIPLCCSLSILCICIRVFKTLQDLFFQLLTKTAWELTFYFYFLYIKFARANPYFTLIFKYLLITSIIYRWAKNALSSLKMTISCLRILNAQNCRWRHGRAWWSGPSTCVRFFKVKYFSEIFFLNIFLEEEKEYKLDWLHAKSSPFPVCQVQDFLTSPSNSINELEEQCVKQLTLKPKKNDLFQFSQSDELMKLRVF